MLLLKIVATLVVVLMLWCPFRVGYLLGAKKLTPFDGAVWSAIFVFNATTLLDCITAIMRGHR